MNRQGVAMLCIGLWLAFVLGTEAARGAWPGLRGDLRLLGMAEFGLL